ncbi:hypothetical protein [Candidatus Nitrospira bockiana]
MKSPVVAFLALLGIGFISSLQSAPKESVSQPVDSALPLQGGLTLVTGTIEAVDRRARLVRVRTDAGRLITIPVATQSELDQMIVGHRIEIEILLEPDNRADEPPARPALIQVTL